MRPNLYLRRSEQRLVLTIEHRAAPQRLPLDLELRADPGLSLEVAQTEAFPSSTPASRCPPTERVMKALVSAAGPLTRREIRTATRMRSSAVGESLAELVESEQVVRDELGFRLREAVSDETFLGPS